MVFYSMSSRPGGHVIVLSLRHGPFGLLYIGDYRKGDSCDLWYPITLYLVDRPVWQVRPWGREVLSK